VKARCTTRDPSRRGAKKLAVVTRGFEPNFASLKTPL
jgi:hypothetical protein